MPRNITTFSMMTLRITALSLKTHSIMTLSIMMFSKTALISEKIFNLKEHLFIL
jgi:hypothetical protein